MTNVHFQIKSTNKKQNLQFKREEMLYVNTDPVHCSGPQPTDQYEPQCYRRGVMVFGHTPKPPAPPTGHSASRLHISVGKHSLPLCAATVMPLRVNNLLCCPISAVSGQITNSVASKPT